MNGWTPVNVCSSCCSAPRHLLPASLPAGRSRQYGPTITALPSSCHQRRAPSGPACCSCFPTSCPPPSPLGPSTTAFGPHGGATTAPPFARWSPPEWCCRRGQTPPRTGCPAAREVRLSVRISSWPGCAAQQPKFWSASPAAGRRMCGARAISVPACMPCPHVSMLLQPTALAPPSTRASSTWSALS